jgi:hypothetical protein
MTFSRSPRLVKGAFIQFDGQNSPANMIVFQYNPDKIYRRLEARVKKPRNIASKDLPREVITFTITLDAADSLEHADEHPETAETGIYPSLSAIEMLLYPGNSVQTQKSFLGIKWPLSGNKRPLTLFVWGNERLLPVLVTDLNINEEIFDPALNPLRADIEITMLVLNDTDLPRAYRGYEYCKSYLANKINLAKKVYTSVPMSDLKKS